MHALSIPELECKQKRNISSGSDTSDVPGQMTPLRMQERQKKICEMKQYFFQNSLNNYIYKFLPL